jgi:competence protein ComEA
MTVITRLLTTLSLLFTAVVAYAGPVNVNTADAETLSDELTGVGMAKAQAIIEYREQNGPFRTPEDLLNVRGIGERTLDINREFIIVDMASAAGRE